MRCEKHSRLTSLLLFLFWQHKLREQIRLLDFHLSSKQVVEGKLRMSLQVLTTVVEAQTAYPDPAIQETAHLAMKHIRLGKLVKPRRTRLRIPFYVVLRKVFLVVRLYFFRKAFESRSILFTNGHKNFGVVCCVVACYGFPLVDS
jgi:hypothetical protein